MVLSWSHVGFFVLLFGLGPAIIFMLYSMNKKSIAFTHALSGVVEQSPVSLSELKEKMHGVGMGLDFDTAYAWVTFCAFKKDLLSCKDETSRMIIHELMHDCFANDPKPEDMTEYDFSYLLFCMLKIWSNSGLPMTPELIQQYIKNWSAFTRFDLNQDLIFNWLQNEIDLGRDSKVYKERMTIALAAFTPSL